MIDQSQHRQTAQLTVIRQQRAPAPRRVARPAARTVEPANAAGHRGFVILLVSGLAVSVWALFPSAVEPGVYVALPQASPPPAADATPVGPSAAGDPLDQARGATFSLLKAALLQSNPTVYGPALYASAAAAADPVPVRSKLQMLLMLLRARYGDDVAAAALGLKLEDLLRLPDSLLVQLMQHPDLADLNKALDTVFSAPSDLSGIKTELDKIEVTSTEQVDVVKVNGKPAYVVHAAVVQPVTENITAQPMFAALPPAAQLMVAPPAEAPPEMTAAAVAPTEESPPAPQPAARVAAEPTVAPTVESAATAAPESPVPVSVPDPVPVSAPSAEPSAPATSVDVMKTGNKFEPGQTLTSTGTATAPAGQSTAPATVATTAEPAEPTGVSTDSGAGTGAGTASQTDGGSSSSPGESTP